MLKPQSSRRPPAEDTRHSPEGLHQQASHPPSFSTFSSRQPSQASFFYLKLGGKNEKESEIKAAASLQGYQVLGCFRGLPKFKVTNKSWITRDCSAFKLKSRSWVHKTVYIIARAGAKTAWSLFARNPEEMGGVCLLSWRKVKLGKAQGNVGRGLRRECWEGPQLLK